MIRIYCVIYNYNYNFKFDIIDNYNTKYTYGIFVGIDKIGITLSGYQSFMPMPALNNFNGTVSFTL